MAELKIKADSGGGTVSFKGPATTTSNAAVQLTLPVDDGAANQYLKTDGSGVLSWAAAGGSPSIDDNGDATAMTIDSSENIGIGTATPSSWNSDADNLVINSSGNAGITINTGSAGSTSAGNLVFAEGTGGDADKYRGAIKYTHGSDNFTFHVNNAEKMELQSDGDLKLESGNVIINTAGKGILFHAHAAANTLDDYEEGSWDATCDNSVTLTHDELFYTKIGRLVHVCGYLTVNSDNSNSAFVVNNLPFTANSGFGLSAPFCRLYNWNIDSDCKWVAGYTEANKIFFQQVKDDATPTALAADSSAVMILSLTYYQN